MRMFSRALRILSTITLFFFCWTFMPLWEAAAWAATPQGQGSSSKGQGTPVAAGVNLRDSAGERFEKALEDIRENVGRAEKRHERGEDDKAEREHIRSKRVEIDSLDAELRKEFSATEKKLKDAKLSKEILDRHYKFVKHYEDNLKELRGNLDEVDKYPVGSIQGKEALKRAKDHLERTKPPIRHKPFNPSRLPSNTRDLKPVRTSWLNQAMDWLVPSAEAAETPPISADLAETLETTQTQEIRDLAQKLGGTSVSLYEYVRNVYTYESYAGSTKGAVQTFKEKTGNEWDQASLLIALYRASGIPARYAVGMVEIPIDKAMSWLGVEDPGMAGTLLSTLGKSASFVILGGKVTALRFQHVWVRAYVPFLYSRGATNSPGDMWVDIDPSFKSQTITKTLTTTGIPTFDQTNYLSTFRTESPLDFYKTQLQSFLDANNLGYVPEALAPESEITPERFGILIGQPPYTIKSIMGTYSEVPDSYRQKFILSITDPSAGENLFYFSAPMPQIIGKRLTISYTPATNADEALIADYGGLYSTPAYLLSLKPQIKLNGTIIAQGNAIGFGKEQKLEFIFDTTIDTGRVENIIIAGGYYAVGLSVRFSDTRDNLLERTNQLAKVAGAIDFNDPSTLDEKLGEVLYLSSVVYHQNLDGISKKIASLYQIVDVRDVSEMMYFLSVKVNTVFDMPRKVTPAGITGDADRDLHTIVPVDGNTNCIKPFMQLVGNLSSYLEHEITEKVYQTEAISAVKAIQIAHDEGIPVHTISDQNINAELPSFQLAADVKNDIINAVNAGQEVIVPERNLNINAWSGVGYIIQDPIKGKGAYLISGGYNGVVAVGVAIVEDLQRNPLVEFLTPLNLVGFRRTLCYPSNDNIKGTPDDVCFTELSYGDIDRDEIAGCGETDLGCQRKYSFSHVDFYQPLIRADENGMDAHLTKNITATDWQSQDNAPYMRAGTAILTAIEFILGFFFRDALGVSVGSHGLRPGGSAYRTQNRIDQIRQSGNTRVSATSHHKDGVAADIIMTSNNTSVSPTPKKCEVLLEASIIIGGRGEVLHEGTIQSVHIAVPGSIHTDSDRFSWGCQ